LYASPGVPRSTSKRYARTTSRTSLTSRTGSSEPTGISSAPSASARAMRAASAGMRYDGAWPGPAWLNARVMIVGRPLATKAWRAKSAAAALLAP
jgi:hypothetical protein